MKQRLWPLLLSVLFTVAILVLAYISYGPYTTILLSGGFVIGLVLWLIFPGLIEYDRIRWPFLLTMGAFLLLHKPEEALLKFQDELCKITGSPSPDPSSPPLIALAVLSIAGWLLVPVLVPRRVEFGSFLAWSFFASMGITELAHYAFPLFRPEPYGFFPGMASVAVLAPLAWWGLYRSLSTRFVTPRTGFAHGRT